MKRPYILVVAAVCTLLSSCFKEKTFSVIPTLKVTSIDVVDSTRQGVATMKFTDGDGDIDSLLVNYNVFVNGAWVPALPQYGETVRDVTPSGRIKSIEGELTVNGLFLDTLSKSHQAKLIFILMDRAGHTSEPAESPVFVLGM